MKPLSFQSRLSFCRVHLIHLSKYLLQHLQNLVSSSRKIPRFDAQTQRILRKIFWTKGFIPGFFGGPSPKKVNAIAGDRNSSPIFYQIYPIKPLFFTAPSSKLSQKGPRFTPHLKKFGENFLKLVPVNHLSPSGYLLNILEDGDIETCCWVENERGVDWVGSASVKVYDVDGNVLYSSLRSSWGTNTIEESIKWEEY